MKPTTPQRWLSTVGLAMDIVGALLIGMEALRKFKGTRLVKGQTYDDVSKPPQHSDEFESWSNRNFSLAWIGLGFLVFGFSLQILAVWISVLLQ